MSAKVKGQRSMSAQKCGMASSILLPCRASHGRKEMFQPTTERVNSLTIDDVAGQAVPASGTGRAESSVANSRKPHSRYLQSMSPH